MYDCGTVIACLVRRYGRISVMSRVAMSMPMSHENTY
jgi:hypothetical protein